MTDLSNIITQLEQQREAIDSALAALRNIGGAAPAPAPAPARGPGRPKGSGAKKTAAPAAESQPRATRKRRLSPEGRKRIIEAAKRRWAMKRANEGGQGGGAKKATKKSTKKAAAEA